MPVPKVQFVRRSSVVLALIVLLASTSASARGPEPPERIPLASLGFQPFTAAVLAAGGTLTTVHFVDNEHLLVTFNVRRLMKRLVDEPPDDQDRTVEAVLVHLPSGKVLARTQWRLHDPSQYLWPLGHGRFLLRIRDTLTTFVPLANLANGDPFAEQPFLRSADRRIVAVLLSPNRDLATVETLERRPINPDDPNPPPASKRTQINFYRIIEPVQKVDQVIVQAAGIATAREPVDLSLTSAGYIEVLQESSTRWLFDFDSFGGSFKELSPIDTTCRPHPVFVNAAEFIAVACLGGSEKLALGGFNMRGEQMWQQNFPDVHAFPNFDFAPAAGRFAFSRNIVASGSGITVDFAPSAFTTQQIRIYQSYSGKQLMQIEASPVQRTGQNYDLSDDGLRVAVVRGDAIEIHRLPALTTADEAALKASRALEPEDAKLAVNMSSHLKPPAGKSAGTTSTLAAANPQNAPEPSAATVTVPSIPPPETRSTNQVGDVQDDKPRKPPTLYTLPTDKPTDKPEYNPH
jgi:hypothetical protein